MPVIIEGNHDFFRVIGICKRQWRSGFSGPTGLDFQVILIIADKIGVEVDQYLLDKLELYESITMNEMSKMAEKEKEK